MAISVDTILAGMQQPNYIAKGATGTLVAGRPHSTWYQAGAQGAGVAPSSGIGGGSLTATVTGQIPFTNPALGNTYLARLQAMATQPGTLLLCDRLWANSGINDTLITEQTFTGSGLIPARDRNGTTVGTDVFAGIEVSVATGAGTPTLTLKYLNTAGQTKTATNIDAAVASSIAGSFYRIGLATGDYGIQNAVSLTLSATWTSGTIHVILYRVLAALELTGANTPNAIDALTAGLPRIYDNSVPFFIFIPSTTTSSNISGQVVFTQLVP